MTKFKNDKGLTLIELLITIAVLAVVSAIALPVINNVVSSSNSNAAAQTQSDVTDFITKYNAAGEVLVSADGRTLQGYVDTDGDNTIDSNELIDTLTIDSKFSFSAAGTSDSVGGSYTSKGISGATVGLASSGTGTPVANGDAATFTALISSLGATTTSGGMGSRYPTWSPEHPYLMINTGGDTEANQTWWASYWYSAYGDPDEAYLNNLVNAGGYTGTCTGQTPAYCVQTTLGNHGLKQVADYGAEYGNQFQEVQVTYVVKLDANGNSVPMN